MRISFRRARRLRNRAMNCRSCAVLAAVALFANSANAATLLGRQVQPGGTLDLQFPLSNYLQQMAAEGGRNPQPTTGRVLLFFPNNFDPARSWPILVVTSTSDLERTSIMDAPAYRDPATKEGWIILATDATIRPRADSVRWRLSILSAAFQLIRKEWPQSANWPVAFAGFSGGAKRSGIEAAMLAVTQGFKIDGMFLAGINSDELSAACRDFHPPAEFFNTPVWISSGDADPIAPSGAQEKVFYSIKRTGFKNVRLEKFFGSHQLKKTEVQRALRWFREVGKF
jgi:hypothetical protein